MLKEIIEKSQNSKIYEAKKNLNIKNIKFLKSEECDGIGLMKGTLQINNKKYEFSFSGSNITYTDIIRNVGEDGRLIDRVYIVDANNKDNYISIESIGNLTFSKNVISLSVRVDNKGYLISVPVLYNKAKEFFKGKYSIRYCKAFYEEVYSGLGTPKAQKILAKILEQLINERLFVEVEGSFYFNIKQQAYFKDDFKKKIKDLGLNIDNETKSVIEFSGNILKFEIDELNQMSKELDNCSYILEL